MPSRGFSEHLHFPCILPLHIRVSRDRHSANYGPMGPYLVLSMKSPIPGLSRGIQVLNLLNMPMPLEEIVRKTGIPKTTVLRILSTLRREGLVDKNEASRTYGAVVQLVARETERNDFEYALLTCMSRVAAETAQTVEWYLPVPTGHVLANRHAPMGAKRQARSWTGMVRFWSGLLDSVNCIGRVGWLNFPKSEEEFWVYGEAFQKIPLDHDEARRRIIEAGARGYATDEYASDGNICRIACLVRRQGLPVGVLALAQCNGRNMVEKHERNLSIMIREAALLCSEAEAKLDRIEPRSVPDTGDWSPSAMEPSMGPRRAGGKEVERGASRCVKS